MANGIELMRDDLICLGQERVFRCVHKRLVECRVHSLGLFDVLRLNR